MLIYVWYGFKCNCTLCIFIEQRIKFHIQWPCHFWNLFTFDCKLSNKVRLLYHYHFLSYIKNISWGLKIETLNLIILFLHSTSIFFFYFKNIYILKIQNMALWLLSYLYDYSAWIHNLPCKIGCYNKFFSNIPILFNVKGNDDCFFTLLQIDFNNWQ